MSAEFFKKKYILIVGVLTSIFVVLGVYFYTLYLDRATVEAVSQNYYFLVSNSTHVEASTHQIVMDGGAGYLLEKDGQKYVTVSTYLTGDEAESVQNSLDMDTQIITFGVEKLYFKTREQKANAKQIKGAFQSLANSIEVLSQTIVRLENGGTQEACKRVLEILKRQFAYLGKAYATLLPSYSQLCQGAEKQIEKLVEDTVFVSNLRCLQSELCYSYVCLAREFSL